MSLHTTFQGYIYVLYNQIGTWKQEFNATAGESKDGCSTPSKSSTVLCMWGRPCSPVGTGLRWIFFQSIEVGKFSIWRICCANWKMVRSGNTGCIFSGQPSTGGKQLPVHRAEARLTPTSLPITPYRIPTSSLQWLVFLPVPRSTSICSPGFEKTTATTEWPTC